MSDTSKPVAKRHMPKWGWYLFLLFSALSAGSAFKYMVPGVLYGIIPNWGEGFATVWTAYVFEGISRGASHVAYHIEGVGSILAVHMIAGGLTVLLVPLQVSRMWRRGDRRKHVYLGWFLVPVAFIAAVTTPPISFNMTLPFWSESGFALGSVAWLIALVLGVWAIRTKDYVRHQRWMVMMSALSFGAVSFRIQLPVLRFVFGFEEAVVFPYIGWTCWVPNALVVAWWWHRQNKKDAANKAAAQPAE